MGGVDADSVPSSGQLGGVVLADSEQHLDRRPRERREERLGDDGVVGGECELASVGVDVVSRMKAMSVSSPPGRRCRGLQVGAFDETDLQAGTAGQCFHDRLDVAAAHVDSEVDAQVMHDGPGISARADAVGAKQVLRIRVL